MGRKVIDLTDQTYGQLTVLAKGGTNPHGSTLWFCKCSCGRVKDVPSERLRKGQQTCGLCPRPKPYRDFTGRRYGLMTVVGPLEVKSGCKWLVRCDCGTSKNLTTRSLDWVYSCGCKLDPVKTQRRVKWATKACRKRGIKKAFNIPHQEKLKWELILASEKMPEELPWGRCEPIDSEWMVQLHDRHL